MAEKIGRFEILGEIARGPMACVYKASDGESGQLIALKTVSLRALGEHATTWVQRVLEEAESTKVLNSPNLALLYGAGDIGEYFCAALEYVQGNSISTMLGRQENFSIWDVQDIARQACQGLEHAHASNVVHYSLEPAKIMVSWDGTVKILGLGISQMGALLMPSSGGPPAALHYMPPEQLRGEAMDARSNVFSLGAILYEMVTGRQAFSGEDVEQVRQKILNSMPVPPDMILTRIVPGLSGVIMKALCKLPEQRQGSAKELIAELEQCKEAAPGPVSARKPPEPVRGLNVPAGQKPASSGDPAARPLAKAAAAAAGPDGVAISRPASEEFLPTASASALIAEEESATLDAPEVAMRPGRATSFSEIDELPPLKEAYAAPAPSRLPEPEPAFVPESEMAWPRERVKETPAEAAKRAVRELRKVPPKLFLYSIGAAALIILLVVARITYRIHSESSQDEGSTPAALVNPPQAVQPTSPPAPVPNKQASTPAPQAVETIQASRPERPEVISVLPKRKHREARPHATAPAVMPGELNVNSTPEGAQIEVDGQSNAAWVTPNHIADLAPGKHTVVISKAGYVSETRTMEVGAGSKSFLVVQLAQAGASAFISSVPPGAQVLVDGKDAGHTTPLQLQVQKPGPHTFVVRKTGYLDESVTASLQSGQAFQFAPVLRQLGRTDEIHYAGRFKKLFGGSDAAGTGTVTVKTDPKGAQIMVNHKMLDRVSPVQFYLNPGTYVIDITLSGYKSVHRVLNVDKDGKFTIDESLERQ